MASLVTFGDIITQAQQRSDRVNSNFITASEWKSYTNSSLKNLYDKLIEAYGADYFVQTAYSFTTDGTNDAYDLPDDFYKLLGVDLQLSPSAASSSIGWITIWRFNFAARNQWTLPNIFTLWGRTNLVYRLRAGKIWLQPLPAGGQTLRLWYAPAFQNLVNDSDTFDGVNGWEEWVINHVAKKALTKDESDTSSVDSLLAIEQDRLTSVIENRDIGAPATTVDVYAATSGGPWYGNGFGGGFVP